MRSAGRYSLDRKHHYGSHGRILVAKLHCRTCCRRKADVTEHIGESWLARGRPCSRRYATLGQKAEILYCGLRRCFRQNGDHPFEAEARVGEGEQSFFYRRIRHKALGVDVRD